MTLSPTAIGTDMKSDLLNMLAAGAGSQPMMCRPGPSPKSSGREIGLLVLTRPVLSSTKAICVSEAERQAAGSRQQAAG